MDALRSDVAVKYVDQGAPPDESYGYDQNMTRATRSDVDLSDSTMRETVSSAYAFMPAKGWSVSIWRR